MAEPKSAPPDALGRHLPPEILNAIYELAMKNDNISYVLPQPTAAIAIAHPALQRKRKRTNTSTTTSNIAITSMHPLMRTNKASRAIYHSLFRAKTLDMETSSIFVTVLDLNFDYFLDDLVAGACKRSSRVVDFFLEREFVVKLTWTQDFLRKPAAQS